MEIKRIEENGNVNIVFTENGIEVAKARCYFVNTPIEDGKNIGTIGDIEIINYDYSKQLLSECEKVFEERGIHIIIAPMNGNTWRKYRTLKFTNGEMEFLLENVSPSEYNDVFLNNGYEECNRYTSNKGRIDDAYYSESIEIARKNIEEEGIEIRKFNKESADDDLTKIYNVSLESFKRNPYYTDIDKESFLMQYKKYLDMVNSDFILIAEKDGKAIGFVFCIPNYNELKVFGKVKTLILKTIAVLPEYENMAIGNVMLNDISKIAKKEGFEDWIFAFMHGTNTSQKMAKRNKAEVIREYALYRKEI